MSADSLLLINFPVHPPRHDQWSNPLRILRGVWREFCAALRDSQDPLGPYEFECSSVDTIWITRNRDNERRMMTALEMVQPAKDRAGSEELRYETTTPETAHAMPWATLKKMMTDKYSLYSLLPEGVRIRKLKLEMWNLRMFPEEIDKIEKYIGGLPDMIHGSVKASKPKTMQEAIEFTTELMDEKTHAYAERQAERKRKYDDLSKNNQNQQQHNKRQNTGQAYTAGNSDRKSYAGPKPLCSKCNYNHEGPCPPRNCPKLRNNDRGNQAGNDRAPAKVYVVGNAGANPDNVVAGLTLPGAPILAFPERSEDFSPTATLQKGLGACLCKEKSSVRSQDLEAQYVRNNVYRFTNHKSLQHILESEALNMRQQRQWKEREPPLRVRALVMTISLDLPKQILNAQTEARKPENIKKEDVGGMLTIPKGGGPSDMEYIPQSFVISDPDSHLISGALRDSQDPLGPYEFECSSVDTIWITRNRDNERRMMTALEMVQPAKDRAGSEELRYETTTPETAHAMPWATLKKMMTDKYSLYSLLPEGVRIRKLKLEMWNLRMFPEEIDKIEKYIGGLPDMIHGSVKASKPKTMQEAIEFTTELMDEKTHAYAERQAERKRKYDDLSKNNQNQQQQNKRQNTSQAYTAGNSDRKSYAGSKPLCSKCNYNHEGPCPPRNCPKLRNNDRGNQAGNDRAPAKVYVVGNAGANPDNVVAGLTLPGAPILAFPERSEDFSPTATLQKGLGACLCKEKSSVRSQDLEAQYVRNNVYRFTNHKSLQHILESEALNMRQQRQWKEREPPLRVRALVMTISLDLPKQILNAQTEARKPENIKKEDVGGMLVASDDLRDALSVIFGLSELKLCESCEIEGIEERRDLLTSNESMETVRALARCVARVRQRLATDDIAVQAYHGVTQALESVKVFMVTPKLADELAPKRTQGQTPVTPAQTATTATVNEGTTSGLIWTKVCCLHMAKQKQVELGMAMTAMVQDQGQHQAYSRECSFIQIS
ncbi:hypothetical protein Tco_0971494 [Tanacetum coccineum]